MSSQADSALPARHPLWYILGDEGFRLFFPLAALHLALWPILWVAVAGLDLPLANATPPALWHAHELIVGSYGAALLGFLTTAVPEWTDQTPLRRRPLFILAALWAVARLIGLVGWDALAWLGGFMDLGWMAALIFYVARISVIRQTDRLLAFGFWMVVLFSCEAMARLGMVLGDYDLTQTGVYGGGFTFLGFLAIALGRITVPVTNLILDPSEKSSPFRPHPGRLSMSAGLVFLALLGELLVPSDPVRGWLWIAAGAGFFDRIAEHFIGRAFWRLEILMLAGSAGLAGLGLILLGASLLGADFGPIAGLHLAFMGGLGCGVLAVFAIAGLMHSNRSLPFPTMMWVPMGLLLLSVLIRIGPELGWFDHPLDQPYLMASLAWAAVWGIWVWLYLPFLTDQASLGQHRC